MQELNTTASEKIFHCYKDGEWVETFGVWAVSEDQIEIVNEKKIDLSEYDEVRVIELNDDDTYWGIVDEQELDDDYKFKAVKKTFVLPTEGEEYEVVELIDDVLDWETFESSSGNSFINYYSSKKDGMEEIDAEDLIEDDEDFGW